MATGVLFRESVRSEEQRGVITLVHDDFVRQVREAGIAVHYKVAGTAELTRCYANGGIALVLISTYRLTRERALHWVVVTGCDEEQFIDVGRELAIDVTLIEKKDFSRLAEFMSKHHWQIAKRDAGGQARFGATHAVAPDQVPADLLAYAVAAANLIGDGLYGVDMKMTARGPVVIEVNDNPNIDAGNEDSVLGDEMYRIVLRDLVRRLDAAHGLGQHSAEHQETASE